MVYDLFISFNSNDRDCAKKIRDGLLSIDDTLCIFMSDYSIDEIGCADFTKVIEDTIPQSRNMLVVGTSADNMRSKWVTYEWRIFRHHQFNDTKGFYDNLFVAVDCVNLKDLPSGLQICESVHISDYQRIYKYIKKSERSDDSSQLSHGVYLIHDTLTSMGWENALFLTPELLADYESKICGILKTVTIIAQLLLYDSPGGALFEAVEHNLSNGVVYNYIILDAKNAYGLLRKIRYGHAEENQKRLIVEMSDESFWALGRYANVTIYDFKNGRPSEAYLRVLTEMSPNNEVPVFLRVPERFADTIWNNVVQFRSKGLLKRYGGD